MRERMRRELAKDAGTSTSSRMPVASLTSVPGAVLGAEMGAAVPPVPFSTPSGSSNGRPADLAAAKCRRPTGAYQPTVPTHHLSLAAASQSVDRRFQELRAAVTALWDATMADGAVGAQV
jgi:hypothetical protein